MASGHNFKEIFQISSCMVFNERSAILKIFAERLSAIRSACCAAIKTVSNRSQTKYSTSTKQPFCITKPS